MRLRTVFTLVTLSILLHGIYSFKMFLDANFINNNTDLKQKVNSALNGFR